MALLWSESLFPTWLKQIPLLHQIQCIYVLIGDFFIDIIACLDFQKETISHQSVLKKLSSRGIRGKEQAWIRIAKSRKEKWGCTGTFLQWEVTGEFHRNAGIHAVPKWPGKRGK